MKHSRIALAALALFGACSDPVGPDTIDPCPTPCEPAVVDFAIEDVRVTSASIGVHPVTNLRAVSPHELRITYRIINLGDSAAAPFIAAYVMDGSSTDTLTVIAPGDTLDAELVIDTVRSRLSPGTDLTQVSVQVYFPNDTAFANNFAVSEQVHIAVPVLRVVSESVPDDIRVNEPFAASMRVRNLSRFAPSPAMTLTACLFEGSIGCYAGQFTTFVSFGIPALTPDSDVLIADQFVVPPTAAWQDEDLRYTGFLCTGGSDDARPYLSYVGLECLFWSNFFVVPDYEGACAPPLLAPGIPVTLPSYNCGIQPVAPEPAERLAAVRPFHLVSFDALADTTYSIDRSTEAVPVRIYDANGSALHDLDPGAAIRVGAAQRIYVATYTPSPSLTITVQK
ncbi:MAG TPA: hypothetical protein VK912_10390 [Longimicrobiales bacterium]|nr:hypothetical protein [Longimicrobiales bacterium]